MSRQCDAPLHSARQLQGRESKPCSAESASSKMLTGHAGFITDLHMWNMPRPVPECAAMCTAQRERVEFSTTTSWRLADPKTNGDPPPSPQFQGPGQAAHGFRPALFICTLVRRSDVEPMAAIQQHAHLRAPWSHDKDAPCETKPLFSVQRRESTFAASYVASCTPHSCHLSCQCPSENCVADVSLRTLLGPGAITCRSLDVLLRQHPGQPPIAQGWTLGRHHLVWTTLRLQQASCRPMALLMSRPSKPQSGLSPASHYDHGEMRRNGGGHENASPV